MLKPYLKQIIKTTIQGDAREESYYSHLADLLAEFAVGIGKTKTQITILPATTTAGNPDFRVWDGAQNIVGYIEAKKPGENLDVIERSEQLKRYRNTFPNLILTDFYEFRLYRKGEMIDKTLVARASLARKGIPPPVENEERFIALLEKFFAFSLPKVTTAEQLAKELAIRTRFLRDEVISAEMEQQQSGKGELYGFYETFKKFLIANLSEKDFADLFSQTITYGLFAARTRSSDGFNRKLAYDLIPKTIGILRNVFRFVSQGDLPKHMEVMVDDIAEVLNAADARNILHQYFKAGKGEDPIVHFYETFLSEYDPATREKRGVYYTPEPVVRYIVRSVHQVLKTHFGLDDGLASREVTLLDPAGGTLTFPAEAIKLAVKEYSDKYGDGGVHKLISEHILPNFYAFELMMAPYAIGHIKISFLLEELGYTMKNDERFKLYLTNTLDMEDLSQTRIPGLESLSDESHEANQVKKKEKIKVILGNPPYSIDAGTLTNEARSLVDTYKSVDGVKIKERGALQFEKTLQDDYVKFIAFAQLKIEHCGNGIIAFITNNNFLDGPMHRGMRNSLLNTFDEIFTIDLHGSEKRKEKTDSGERDENVFDIQQGVCITLLVKNSHTSDKALVYRADLKGTRNDKYKWLENHNTSNTIFKKFKPEAPWFYFKEFNYKDLRVYEKLISIKEIFPVFGAGIITAHDNFVMNDDPLRLKNRFMQFKRMERNENLLHDAFGVKKKKGWSILEAWDNFIKQSNEEITNKIASISYRPFYSRYILYDNNVVWSSSYPTMQHMLQNNLGLAVGRQGQVVGTEHLWNLAFITKEIIDFNLFYRGGELLFPLYLYKDSENANRGKGASSGVQGVMLFEPENEYDKKGKKPNIAPKVFESLVRSFGHKPTPEQIMYYCYAVMYSNAYREKYAEFLKIDFPRIPFTSDYKLFLQMAELGHELADLHLLKSKTLNRPIVRYWGQGEDLIEKPVYQADSARVNINSGKYFEGITPEMWNYHIGGYKVLEKYLKDRKGRQMSDPATYCKIATAIAESIKIQSAIDPLFVEVEESVLEMSK